MKSCNNIELLFLIHRACHVKCLPRCGTIILGIGESINIIFREERDSIKLAKECILLHFQSANIQNLCFTDIEVTGEACNSFRKAKLLITYELKISGKYQISKDQSFRKFVVQNFDADTVRHNTRIVS